MRTTITILLLCLFTLNLAGQGVVTRQKCTTCGKIISECQYRGKHPAEQKCATCGKIISECQYGGKHPVERKCSTCGKVISKCPYSGKHPAPEAAGYEVTISCNVSNAALYIDGISNGTASGTRFLKTGSHSIKLSADGYEDLSRSITVNSGSRNFSFSMEKKKTPPQQISSTSLEVNGVSFTMMKVAGGTFTMGATSEQQDPFSDEKPTHQVTVSSFLIGQTEVTQALWKAVMGKSVEQIAAENNWGTYGTGDNYPMYYVSWNDCQTFISKLNSLTGKRFRLPTEAEWEFAARGGNNSKHTQYSGSSNIDNVAWYDGNSGNKTHPVATKQANELGIYDMSGNVWEWCSDWSGSYSSGSQTNPTGPTSGYTRVFRGGSWIDDSWYCRVSNRINGTPINRNDVLGLRLCLSEL